MTPQEIANLLQLSGGWGLSVVFGSAMVWLYKAAERERKKLIEKLEAKDDRLYEMGTQQARLTVETNEQIRQLIDLIHLMVRDQ